MDFRPDPRPEAKTPHSHRTRPIELKNCTTKHSPLRKRLGEKKKSPQNSHGPPYCIRYFSFLFGFLLHHPPFSLLPRGVIKRACERKGKKHKIRPPGLEKTIRECCCGKTQLTHRLSNLFLLLQLLQFLFKSEWIALSFLNWPLITLLPITTISPSHLIHN